MNPSNGEFDDLMRQVRAGSPEAAERLFALYGPAVRGVVRRWLQQPLRRHFDSADLEQSVWASFFHSSAERCSFDTPKDLIAFLSRVAYNKVVDATRKRFGAGQDSRPQERSLDEPLGPDSEDPLVTELPAPTHTPSQHVMADERWHKLTSNLPPGHVRILELLQAGCTQTEIADRLNCDPKMIRRLLGRLNQIAFPS
jgi:RNA polymerase sigma factor (sigma-70 family)